MAYEYRGPKGVIRLVKIRGTWRIGFADGQVGAWPSAEAAVAALVRHQSGLPALDRQGDLEVPDDLLDWTPLADSL